MEIALISELNFHFVNNHFTHPDDALDAERGAELGWAELKNRFKAFLDKNTDNMLKCEYFLPFVVDDLLKEGKITVKVMDTTEKWYGVTYKEDKQAVVDAIRQKIADGIYPEKLW
jgi:hypothetical protein